MDETKEKIRVIKGLLATRVVDQDVMCIKAQENINMMAANGWNTEVQYSTVFDYGRNAIFYTCLVIGYTYE